jgi:hypothetical protein
MTATGEVLDLTAEISAGSRKNLAVSVCVCVCVCVCV